ncbi:MAG: TadE/TadG family type IV pilus assembly protein [Planctomycetaceae bacterium]
MRSHHRNPLNRRSVRRRSNLRPESNRRGAVAVEAALLMPFLAAMLLGITEIGQVQRAQSYVSEASYAGCVMGSLPGTTNAAVISDVKSFLTACKMNANSAAITIRVNDVAADVATAKRNDKIKVTVSVPVSAVSWTGTHCFVPSNSTVTKSIVMLRQG